MKISKTLLMTGRTLSVLVGIIGITLFAGASAFAAEADQATERITMSPSSTSLKLNAGETKQGSMKVKNDGDVAYGFSVYARPYGVSNELYEPDFTTQKSNTSVYKWVQFDQTKYQVAPGQEVEVRYTIRVPADAAPGGHYGVLFAETDERGLEGTGVARKKRVGNLLYVTVNGQYKTSGTFKEFILPFWQTSAPLVSSVRIENNGNVDFRAKVSTVAKDLFGGTKYSYTGDPIALPGTTRLMEMKWEKAPNFGIFKIEQSVEFLGQKQVNDGYVLIAPRWAPVVLIVILSAGAAYAVLQRRNSRR
jgi:hypothetical protein